MLSNQVHLKQSLLNFLFHSADTLILLRTVELSSIVADNHSNSCFLVR